ncbi:MAG TPA: hypothetical protein DCF63_19885 [Planctomycetaceae bacterium]|nr:hypothetical protein [Planctomycetaceae bacterium]
MSIAEGLPSSNAPLDCCRSTKSGVPAGVGVAVGGSGDWPGREEDAFSLDFISLSPSRQDGNWF